MTNIRILSTMSLLLLAGCGSTGVFGPSIPTAERNRIRQDVLKHDREVIRRETAQLQHSTRGVSCSETPEIEIKRLITKPEIIAERWIVTHPACDATHLY